MNFSTVTNSHSSGSITMKNTTDATNGGIGGLVGSIVDLSYIKDSYSTLNISDLSTFSGSGEYKIGGLVGGSSYRPGAGDVAYSVIENSYASGNIKTGNNTQYTGGLTGGVAEIISSFWTNSASSACGDGTGLVTDSKKISASQLNQSSTFINAGWSEDVWEFSGGSAPSLDAVDSVELTFDKYSDYIKIYTAEDLANISRDVTGKYILMNDIDLSSVSNWAPIRGEQSFSGILEGNGHKITGMNINSLVTLPDKTSPEKQYYGLFAKVSGEIRNLGIENATINLDDASYHVGILAGNVLEGARITNVYITNSSVDSSARYTGFVSPSRHATVSHKPAPRLASR